MSGNQKVLGIVSIVCGAVGICFARTIRIKRGKFPVVQLRSSDKLRQGR